MENNPRLLRLLLAAVFVTGLTTILYELLIGSVSSYLLGDSIKQFSLTIGLSMTAMGIGTWLSRYFNRYLLFWFIFVEIALGLVGGISVPVLYLAYATSEHYYTVMLLFIFLIGGLIGLEIPFLTRLMESRYSLQFNISNVLSLDYIGALAATLLFPFIILPLLGIFKAGLAIALLNFVLAVFCLWVLNKEIENQGRMFLRGFVGFLGVVLIGLFFSSNSLLKSWESALYADRVIYSEQTSYQKIVLTQNRGDLRLFLDGNLQFSSVDEFRYHEAIVHIPYGLAGQVKRVLILGGGDGLILRELQKHPHLDAVDLVDLDPKMTDLGRNHHKLKKVNQDSFQIPNLQVYNQDAFEFLKNRKGTYDLILADLPDPKNISLARLYSVEFYRLIQSHLNAGGVFATQATSPFFAQKAYWSIEKSLAEVFAYQLPFHLNVPSMGDWGFVAAANYPLQAGKIQLPTGPVQTRHLNAEILPALFLFGEDVKEVQVKPNHLNNPELLQYYLGGWKQWR